VESKSSSQTKQRSDRVNGPARTLTSENFNQREPQPARTSTSENLNQREPNKATTTNILLAEIFKPWQVVNVAKPGTGAGR
jgi:hypothetical protein